MTFVTKGLTSSIKQDWKTPKALYDELNKEFNFDFDPCPINPSFDGLLCDWGLRNYVNPPYKDVSQWIIKALNELEKGKMSVFLIFARTDTKYFHQYLYKKDNIEIRFLKGRLKFLDINDIGKYPAPAPSMIVIMRVKI